MTRPHTTHHESCGCCEAERDALKAQVERLREALDGVRVWVLDSQGRDEAHPTWYHPERIKNRARDLAALEAALASTPAQSLAAHDAEVRAKALRDAAALWPCFFCNGLGSRGPYERDTPDGPELVPRHKCGTCGGTGRDAKQAVAILALADKEASNG